MTFKELPLEMELEAITAGVYTSPTGTTDYPRIQPLTIRQLLEQAERIANRTAAKHQELFG